MRSLIVICVLAVAACGAPTTTVIQEPAPTVTVTQEPTAPETPKPTEEPDLAITLLDTVWEDTSKADRATMCAGYAISPQYIWSAFKKNANGALTKAAFMDFMDEHCA